MVFEDSLWHVHAHRHINPASRRWQRHTGTETKNKTEGGSGPHTCEKGGGCAYAHSTSNAYGVSLTRTRGLPRQN